MKLSVEESPLSVEVRTQRKLSRLLHSSTTSN